MKKYNIEFTLVGENNNVHWFSVSKYKPNYNNGQSEWIELAGFPDFEQAKAYADELNELHEKCKEYNKD